MTDVAMLNEHMGKVIEAVQAGRLDEVRELTERMPALVKARNEAGVSLVMLALYHGQGDIAAWIAERRGWLDMFEAAALGDAARVRTLLDGDPLLVQAWSADGFSALALASFFGRGDLVSLLLDRGADVNAASRTPPGYTPLTGAVTARHAGVVAELLRRGADANYRYGPGYTPLHAACANGTAEIVRMLLEAGADPHARTDDGRSPGDVARERGHVEVAELVSGKTRL